MQFGVKCVSLLSKQRLGNDGGGAGAQTPPPPPSDGRSDINGTGKAPPHCKGQEVDPRLSRDRSRGQERKLLNRLGTRFFPFTAVGFGSICFDLAGML